MTAELEDQQEKPKDEKVEETTTESDDEKIQKIGEDEETDDLKKNGAGDKNETSEKPTVEQTPESEGQEGDGGQEDESAVAPRRKSPRFWEKLFSRAAKRHDNLPQDAEAGTELLAKEGNKIEIKEEEGKHEKNDSGTDVTVPITDDSGAEGKPKEKVSIAKYTGPYWRRVGIGLLTIAILLILVTVVCMLTAGQSRGPMVEPVIITDCGLLRGYIDDGIYVFRGIPYALPPIGERRWQPPQTASNLNDCWSDTYQAINNSVYCYQKSIPGVNLEMSEDCLYLDVITPSLSPPKPRPVVVYIPGDNPVQGYSADDLNWRPTVTLTDEKDVTFVTINYRVGIFGFLTLDLLTQHVRPPTSGNYGIMDMIAALKWVQKNIRAFGGDPRKVTILAHGGAATAAIALLSSKKTEGLFDKLWLISPASVFSNRSLTEIGEDNAIFLTNIGCKTLDCLYNKSSGEVLQATPSFWQADWSIKLPSGAAEPSPVMTVVDGMILYDTPQNMWIGGDINKVPVVIGTAAQETASSALVPDLETWSWTDFNDYVSEKLGRISTNLTVAAVEFYIHNSSTPGQQLHSMVSDIRTICPLKHLTEALDDSSERDIYWYVVDYKPGSAVQFSNDSEATTLSTHGLDIASIFGLLHRYVALPMTPADVTFQKNIQDLFYSFVSRGTPEVRKESLMPSGFINIIGDHIRSGMTPYENCHVWDNADMFPRYAKTI